MLCKLLSGGFCAAALLAQAPSAPAGPKMLTLQVGDPAQFGPVGITTVLAGPVQTIAGAPYSADAVTERTQTLADGNRIVQKTTSTVARDGQGRVRREEVLPGFTSSGGENPRMVMIDDPVAGVSWRLDPRTKTAFKMPAPPFVKGASGLNLSLPPLPAPPPLAPSGAKTWFFATSSAVPAADVHVDQANKKAAEAQVSKTDLGTQTVEGVPAQGTRIARTLPAGAVGNEQPLVIISESWYSPDLKVLVSTKMDDPRMGETTYKLTNLQRGEPSPELFEVPGDYAVKTDPAPNVIYKELHKPQ